MKKLLLTISIITLFSFNSVVDYVYICDSKTAKKYHYDKNCRGIKSCKFKIVKITLSEAEEKNKTLCGFE